MGVEYPVAPVGPGFRSEETKKIIVTAPDKEYEVVYLMNLALYLMEHDRNAPQVVSFVRGNTYSGACPASASAKNTVLNLARM